MSGAVAQRANGMSKALGGKVTFFYALTRVFFEWENTEVRVTFDDGERRGRMHDVVVANGVWHGGGMMLAPGAAPDDGLFDVVLIGDVGKVDFLTTAPKIYKGRHVTHPKVEVVRTAHGRRSTPTSGCRSRSRASRSERRPATSRSCRAPCGFAFLARTLGRRPRGFGAGVALAGRRLWLRLELRQARSSSSARRCSIASSPRTRFVRSSTRSSAWVAPCTTPSRRRVL